MREILKFNNLAYTKESYQQLILHILWLVIFIMVALTSGLGMINKPTKNLSRFFSSFMLDKSGSYFKGFNIYYS